MLHESTSAVGFHSMNVTRSLAAVAVWSLLAFLPLNSEASTESDLKDLEEQRREAIRTKDFATLSRIYAPGFLAVGGNGQVIDREQLFKLFSGTDPSLSFKTDEIRVLDQGDTAVFFGRLRAFAADGKALFATRFSHTFVKQGGKWVCIAGQSTPIAATQTSAAPPAK
jgi:ketosteroid isomerase-like protein